MLFDKLAPANEVAAIIVEPIQGEGGYIVPEDGFLQGLRDICDRHGILLIADEIQSGAGRTGAMWAIEHCGRPAGHPAHRQGHRVGHAARCARGPGRPARSRGGPAPTARPTAATRSPVRAALATISLLEGGLIDNAAARGAQAVEGLRPLIERFAGLVRDVRGKGLMLGIEFDTAEHAEAVQTACFERGLLVLECGTSSVRMCPALTVTEAEMATALRVFGEAVAHVAGGVVAGGADAG